jgi:hypothetical protein
MTTSVIESWSNWWELGRQLEMPLADRARALEWRVPVVAHVGVEQPVILSGAGDDRPQGPGEVSEAGVVALEQPRLHPDRAAEQRRRAVDAGVRAHHARDAEADRLDPAQVVPGAVQVEDRLGQGHEALAGGLEAQKGLGVELTAWSALMS